jgi:alpha-tubulin suppressor-like RCC1 family protein
VTRRGDDIFSGPQLNFASMLRKLILALCLVSLPVAGSGAIVSADQSDGPASDASDTGTLTAGEVNTCYLAPVGSLYCWGLGQYGAIGDVTFGAQAQKTPAQVTGGGLYFDLTQITAGDTHICALTTDTKVKCWGGNRFGQTGNGRTSQSGTGNTNEVHFLHADLGSGTYDDNYVIKTDNSALSGVSQVSAGLQFTCAIATAGKVWCWGHNGGGQSGYGDVAGTSPYAAPKARAVRDGSNNDVTGFTSVSAGELFACGLKSNGTVWCWGNNINGQLGDGGSAASAHPVQVSAVSGATAIAAGAKHACALTASGLYCWGNGADGRLGSSQAGGAVAPVAVAISNVTRISAGYAHSCALDSSNQLWCWGRFYNGYFEDANGGAGATTSIRDHGVFGQTTTSLTPQIVDGLGAVKAFASGNNHVCALVVDGPFKCWGVGSSGQIGNNFTTPYVVPQVVTSTATQAFSITQPGTVRFADGTVTLSSTTSSGVTPSYASTTDSVCSVSGSIVTIKNVGTCSISGSAPAHAVYQSATTTRSFTIGASAPLASTGSVSSITPSGATLSATVDARGASTAPVFEISESADMASSSTVTMDAVEGVGSKSISKAIALTKPVTTYYYRVKATNDQGQAVGEIKSFSTTGSAPAVTTGSASPRATSATLNGVVDSKGLSTEVSYVYGTDPQLSNPTNVAGATQNDNGAKDVSVSISNLTEKTTYYYRLEAVNVVGKTLGEIRSFTTTKPEGVSIDDGAEFTNSQSVVVSVVGPSTAVKAILSNDGGFKTSETFDLTNNAAEIPWKLPSSREGTFTKIIYVKYVSRFGSQSTPYTDDILLDTTKPVVDTAVAALTAAPKNAVSVARAKAAQSAVKLSLRGSDTISGIGRIEVRSSARKPSTTFDVNRVQGKANGKPRPSRQSVTFTTVSRAVQFRVVDRAGNASPWKVVKIGS